MTTPSAGLVLDYLPLSGGTARLVRVYGDAPCLALPAALPGPEGSALPITELGSYAFSEALRTPPGEGLLRCGVDETGSVHPLPLDPGAELHPIAGRFLEEIALPDSLRVIGSCAFYNCRALRRLSAGSGPLTLGSDVFLNCFALEELRLRAEPEQSTGLFALVNNMTGNLRALFWPEEAAQPRAALWYPEYWEDIEETPAHILLHTFSGQGYHYRQCFRDGRLLPGEYDAVFAQGHGGDDPTYMALLCLDRLRYPWQLEEGAAGLYRAFLARQGSVAAECLIRAQDREGLKALLGLGVMDGSALAAASRAAQRAGDAQAAALLADAEYQAQAAAPRRRRRYDFDF